MVELASLEVLLLSLHGHVEEGCGEGTRALHSGSDVVIKAVQDCRYSRKEGGLQSLHRVQEMGDIAVREPDLPTHTKHQIHEEALVHLRKGQVGNEDIILTQNNNRK